MFCYIVLHFKLYVMKNILMMGAFVTAMAVTSCSTVKEMPADDLSGEWNVVEIEGKTVQTVEEQEIPFMAFDVVNARVFGSAGCNRIFGQLYTGEKGSIDFSSLAATRMMCPDMSNEDALLVALNQVKRFGINNEGQLVLMDGHNREMVTLDKRTDIISPASLTGEWNVDFLGDMDLTSNPQGTYTITFDPTEKMFSMATGCNNVGGNYGGTYVDISFTNLMTTRMMCPDMTVEETAQRLLPTITWFDEVGNPGSYGFYDAANNLVMTISPIIQVAE